jgi:hypothetical protein
VKPYVLAIGVFASSLAIPLSDAARAAGAAEIDQALLTAFQSWDDDGDGILKPQEGEKFIKTLFAAADTDANKSVSAEEFRTISLGLAPLAEKYGKAAEYAAARDSIYGRWDTRRSGNLTFETFRLGIVNDFDVAAPGMPKQLDFEGFKTVRFIGEMIASLQ